MSTSLFARLHRRFNPQITAANRRQFLQASLAASAGLLLSDHASAAQTGTQKRVIVIGAGFSGLACAHELKSAGYKVTVFESRPRLGGRVLSFKDFVPGKNVEGGAELIGSNHPTWVRYADKFGLEFIDVLEDEDALMPVYLDGKMLTKDEVDKLYVDMDAVYALLSKAAAAIDPEQPWLSPDAAKLDSQSIADWLKTLEAEEFTRRAVGVQLASDNAIDNAKASLLGMLTAVIGGGGEKYWTDTEVYRCKGGNQQLALRLAEAIGADNIRLRLPVTEIKVTADGVVVTCADGRTIEADDVVLAVPPTTWHKIKFSPELPEKLKPQMGVAVKYEVAFKRRFWVEKNIRQYALTDGDVSQTWELTDNQQQDAKEVDTPGGLVAFSGGSAAEHCRSRKKDARDAHYAAEFERLFPGYGEQKTDVRFMDWPGEEWTLGGYSFPAPGQITALGPMLYKGLGRLHFAGEHTCYRFVGYMEGGLYSGASLAKRLAVRDGVKAG